jgi:hypothetical protein
MTPQAPRQGRNVAIRVLWYAEGHGSSPTCMTVGTPQYAAMMWVLEDYDALPGEVSVQRWDQSLRRWRGLDLKENDRFEQSLRAARDAPRAAA